MPLAARYAENYESILYLAGHSFCRLFVAVRHFLLTWYFVCLIPFPSLAGWQEDSRRLGHMLAQVPPGIDAI
jgi:hypothetical protein